jgi:hypothetical protein
MSMIDRRRLLLDKELREWLREEVNRRRREQEIRSGRLTPGGSRRSTGARR